MLISEIPATEEVLEIEVASPTILAVFSSSTSYSS
jgi:hypothetical protein